MEIKEKKRLIKDGITEKMKEVFDPEIPVNIYDLGLIYEIKVDDDLNAHILMSLTSPNCPVAESLPVEVKEKAATVDMVKEVEVEITFDPPWTQDMITEEGLLELGMM